VFKSVIFEVVGDQPLACEGCEERVEDLLKAMRGVRQVRARAPKQRIEVLFDATQLETAAIAERLRDAGYETRIAS
jgi:copper chaperone CopZ